MAFDYTQYLSQGANPYSYSNPYSNPYGGMDVDYSQGDPAYAMKQNRGYASNWGKNIDAYFGGQQSQQDNLFGYYGNLQNNLYGDLAETPGWTQDESGNIIRADQYNSGMTTQDQFNSLNPTDAESQGMRGDTSGYGFWFNPSSMNANAANSSTFARDSINNAAAGMGGSIDYERSSINNALNDSSLTPSSEYYGALGDAYSGTRANVEGAIDQNRLSLNLDPKTYQMGDQEVQDIQNRAAQTVLGQRTNAIEDIRKQALASGNADPAAYAALRTQYQGQADKDAADASTDAYLKARGAQRDLAMNYAQGNLGANQAYAGLRAGAEQGLGNMGVNVAQTAENTNLGAGQYRANQRIGTAEEIAGQSIGQNAYQGTGNQQNSLNFANLYNNALQYEGTQGMNIAQAQDVNNVNRANNLYGIRQGNTMYGQQQKFNQNFATQGQMSNLYGQQANARIAGQNNLRNWASGQNAQALQGGLGYGNQRLQAGQTAIGGVNTATGQWGSYDLGRRNTGFTSNFLNAFGGALGKTLGSPSFGF